MSVCPKCGMSKAQYGEQAGICGCSIPRFTRDEVMSALSDAFPSPRTSRDCITEKNLRDILSARNVEVDSAPPKSKPWTERIVGANQPQPSCGQNNFMRYRKKPVVIEAFQMTEKRRNDNMDWPEWLNEAWNKKQTDVGALFIRPMDHTRQLLAIATMEGPLMVSWGDWIIKGVQGELYPCKPDIFAATYEPA